MAGRARRRSPVVREEHRHLLPWFSQPIDFMDCAAILAEVQTNNDKVKQLAADKGLKTTQNVAAGSFPFFGSGMDFQGTADTGIRALQSRQQYLSMMADQKRCGVEPEPSPVAAKRQKKRVSHVIKPVPTAPASATQQDYPLAM